MFYVVMRLFIILILLSSIAYTVEIVVHVEDVKELDKKAQTLTTILCFDVLDQEERNMKVFTSIFHFPGGTSSMLEEIYYAKVDGKATAKVRYQVKGQCELQWRSFPFDKHECETKIYLKRISPNQHHIEIEVSNPDNKIFKNSHIDGLTIGNITSYECEKKVLQEGVKQCIVLKIGLYRDIFPILIKYFIPSLAIIFVVWLTLFINRENIVARLLALGGSTGLLIFVTWNTEQNLPTLAYFSGSDIWEIICYVFIFITFIQVISIHILLSSADKFYALSIGDPKITTRAKYRHFRTESRRSHKKEPKNHVVKLNVNGRATSVPPSPNANHLMETSYTIELEFGAIFRKKFEIYTNYAKIIELTGRLLNLILFLIAAVLYFVFYLILL